MMEIVRDDEKIRKYTQIGLFTNMAGLLVIGGGLVWSLSGAQNSFATQWLTLVVGLILWQISLYFSRRFGRSPRVDEILDQQLQKGSYRSYFYHYVLPAEHVLLTRAGPVVMVAQPQSGTITVDVEDGDKWHWQTGLFRKLFGSEPRLGNPSQLAEAQIGRLIAYIKENAPDLEEVPIAGVIVFTNPDVVLKTDDVTFPTTHVKDLKKLMRKQTGTPLPKEKFTRLREIFDQAVDFD